MKKGILFVIGLVIAFAGYKVYFGIKRITTHVSIIEGKDTNIVLVNIGDGDRKYIATVLNHLTILNPQVIGIDAFFATRKDSIGDEMLRQSLRDSEIILGIKTEGTKLYGTDIFFTKNNKVGVAMLKLKDSYADNYQVQYPTNYGMINHISVSLAKRMNPKKANVFLKRNGHKTNLPIQITKFKNQFTYYEYKDLSFKSKEIEGKIILLGYLGPGNEDKFKTYSSVFNSNIDTESADMYGCTIIANQIRMVLEEN